MEGRRDFDWDEGTDDQPAASDAVAESGPPTGGGSPSRVPRWSGPKVILTAIFVTWGLVLVVAVATGGRMTQAGNDVMASGMVAWGGLLVIRNDWAATHLRGSEGLSHIGPALRRRLIVFARGLWLGTGVGAVLAGASIIAQRRPPIAWLYGISAGAAVLVWLFLWSRTAGAPSDVQNGPTQK